MLSKQIWSFQASIVIGANVDTVLQTLEILLDHNYL